MKKMREKYCSTCHEKRPINMFSVNREMSDGHLNKCKPCINDSNRRRKEQQEDWRSPLLDKWGRA